MSTFLDVLISTAIAGLCGTMLDKVTICAGLLYFVPFAILAEIHIFAVLLEIPSDQIHKRDSWHSINDGT